MKPEEAILEDGAGPDAGQMDIAAAGRRKDVRPCMLVEEVAFPANPDSHARPYEGEEGEAVPAGNLVSGEFPDDGDWPF